MSFPKDDVHSGAFNGTSWIETRYDRKLKLSNNKGWIYY